VTPLAIILARRLRAALNALPLVMLIILLWVSGVAAHGVDLLESDPFAGAALVEPPDHVRATFSAQLATEESTLQVFNSDGEQVDNGDGGLDPNDPGHVSMIVSLPPLAGDIYTVRWYAALEDGDATEGLFRFTVGNPAVAPDQVALPEPLSVDDGNGVPVVGLAGLLGAVLLVVLAVVFRGRLFEAR
jgi:copper transport protein